MSKNSNNTDETTKMYKAHLEVVLPRLTERFGWNIKQLIKEEKSLAKQEREISAELLRVQLDRNAVKVRITAVKAHLRSEAEVRNASQREADRIARKSESAARARRARTIKNPTRAIERGGSTAAHGAIVLMLDAYVKAFGLDIDVFTHVCKEETSRLQTFAAWCSMNVATLKSVTIEEAEEIMD